MHKLSIKLKELMQAFQNVFGCSCSLNSKTRDKVRTIFNLEILSQNIMKCMSNAIYCCRLKYYYYFPH